MNDRKEILEFLREFCKNQLDFNDEVVNSISEETILNKDLQMDELDLVEMQFAIERRFDVKIDIMAFGLFTINDWRVKDVIDEFFKARRN